MKRPNPGSADGKQAASVRQNLAEDYRARRQMTRGRGGEDEEGDDCPRVVLMDAFTEAADSFSVAMDDAFSATSAAAGAMRKRWGNARSLFVPGKGGEAAREKVITNATASLASLRQNKNGPKKMDLFNVLVAFLELPKAAEEDLLANVDGALDSCVQASIELVTARLQTMAEAVSSSPSDHLLVSNLLTTEFVPRIGFQILRNAIDKAKVKDASINGRLLRSFFEEAKAEACTEEVAKKQPTPTANDPAGVATMVDGRLDALLAAVVHRFKDKVRRRLDNIEQSVEAALSPPTTLSKHARPKGMEQALIAGYAFLADQLSEHEPADQDRRAQNVIALLQRGDGMRDRLAQVKANLGAALGPDPEARGRAVRRLIETQNVFRGLQVATADGSAFARPQHLDKLSCVDRPRGVRVLNVLNAALLATQADGRRMAELRGALAGLARPLVDVEAEGEAAGPEEAASAERGSLWRAIAHQFFRTASEDTQTPELMMNAVTQRQLEHFGRRDLRGPLWRRRQRAAVRGRAALWAAWGGPAGALLHLHALQRSGLRVGRGRRPAAARHAQRTAGAPGLQHRSRQRRARLPLCGEAAPTRRRRWHLLWFLPNAHLSAWSWRASRD